MRLSRACISALTTYPRRPSINRIYVRVLSVPSENKFKISASEGPGRPKDVERDEIEISREEKRKSFHSRILQRVQGGHGRAAA
eukprot:943387-Amorphochlora_amoeboformis.AAC.1